MSTANIDWDFGYLGERSIQVEFAYVPEHKGGFDEPPTHAEYEIEAITLEGKDIFWMFDKDAIDDVIQALEEARGHY